MAIRLREQVGAALRDLVRMPSRERHGLRRTAAPSSRRTPCRSRRRRRRARASRAGGTPRAGCRCRGCSPRTSCSGVRCAPRRRSSAPRGGRRYRPRARLIARSSVAEILERAVDTTAQRCDVAAADQLASVDRHRGRVPTTYALRGEQRASPATSRPCRWRRSRTRGAREVVPDHTAPSCSRPVPGRRRPVPEAFSSLTSRSVSMHCQNPSCR